MKKRKSNDTLLVRLVTAFVLALVAACVTVLLIGERILFFVFAAITVSLFLWSIFSIKKSGNIVSGFYQSVIRRLTTPNSDLFNHFHLPVVLLRDDSVIWYNSLFRSNILKGEDIVGPLTKEVLSPAARSQLKVSGCAEMEVFGKVYAVYASQCEEDGNLCSVLYYVDLTDLKLTEREYTATRPVVAILSIDSFEEITDDMPESDQAKFKGAIDREIEQFTSQTSGVTKKLKNNRYISVFDERSLEKIKTDKFSVLDRVRALEFGNKVKATLSVGVGHGEKTMKQCEVLALQALEMAQGRGGDQAAIKAGDGYEFFGGVSHTGIEKRTKVKTRVVASALKELIRGSDRVFIMGHRFGDIDSLGSSYALWKCAVQMETEPYIILDESTHLAKSLIERIKKEEGSGWVIDSQTALNLMTRQSLLIICDTHRRDFAESAQVYDACRTTVVIDHHRKNVDFIDNSVIFYHEPHASSTCEMVAELLQYMDNSIVTNMQAEALLAGIMLDTRNFVLRTGVRTFEASAFLRRWGADPVAVKKLFSDSIQEYRQRAALVSVAEFYENCAISVAKEGEPLSRIVVSQAADELLGIENVDASFVMVSSADCVHISARSLGQVNVQLIMEAMGGGGHHTMAAAQISQITLEEAKLRLIQILNTTLGKDRVK